MNPLAGIRLWVFIALFTSFVASTYGFGFYLFPGIVPEMIKNILFTYAEMGITTSVAQAGFLIFSLASGVLTGLVGAFLIIKASIYSIFSLVPAYISHVYKTRPLLLSLHLAIWHLGLVVS